MNGVIFQGFEWYLEPNKQHWKHLTELAPELKAAGFTAIWLPPAYKGASGANDVGYGVYDLYDLGEFDQKGSTPTKYGTKDEYLKCVKTFQDIGIDVYADIVFNQKMGADGVENVSAVPVNTHDREQFENIKENIEAWTKFDFPNRKDEYSQFKWNHYHFDGVDYDARSKVSEIYNLNGYGWNNNVDTENANYDYLMGADVCFKNQDVIDELNTWGAWYTKETNCNGFRLDAVKHIDSHFFTEWLGKLRNDNKKEYFAVGEYWNADVNKLENYLSACENCMSLFDVPLHYNFFAACNTGGTYDMGSILNNTLVKQNPSKAVTFVMNHDTQIGQALQSAILDWFKPLCYAIILLRKEGYPCVFYGDYYGVPSKNKQGFKEVIDLMLKVRQDYMYGDQHDYFDHQDIIGWTLEGDTSHPNSSCAVIMSDGPGGEKKMYVNKNLKGKKYIDILKNNKAEVVIDDDGNGVFPVNGGSISCYILAQ